MIDSVNYVANADSSICMDVHYPAGSKDSVKNIYYFVERRKLILKRQFIGDKLFKEIKYSYLSGSNLVDYIIEFNVATNRAQKDSFSYTYDRINGDLIRTDFLKINNNIEKVTKQYFDKQNRVFKIIDLFPETMDIKGIEDITFTENGQILERSVYNIGSGSSRIFKAPDELKRDSCFARFALSGKYKFSQTGTVDFLKRIIADQKKVVANIGCIDFEHTLKSVDCVVRFKGNTKTHTGQISVEYNLNRKF